MQVSWINIGYFFFLVLLLLASMHYLIRWFHSKDWPFRNTFEIFALIITMFCLGIASIGITHQIYWIFTHKGPFVHSSRFLAYSSEAKLKLAALYSAQKAHFVDYGEYTSDLLYAGIELKSEDERRYQIGFLNTLTKEDVKNKEIKELIAGGKIKFSNNVTFGKLGDNEVVNIVKEKCPDCIVTPQSYKAFAAGYIPDSDEIDIWTIDHNKQIIHLTK